MPPLPRFPLYIPSKNRADICLTAHALERMGVPFRIVVEEQQREAYARVFPDERLLTLDPSYQRTYDTCDELGDTKGKGPGPARNFIWEHAIAEGHEWHWVMDDNISLFSHFHRNQQIPCGDGTPFHAMETFVLRYANIAMAGPSYWTFCPSRRKVPPFVVGTRIYSCNFIRNVVLECTCDQTQEGTVKAAAPASGPTWTGESTSVSRGKFNGANKPPCCYSDDGKERVRIHTDPNCPCAMLDGQSGKLMSSDNLRHCAGSENPTVYGGGRPREDGGYSDEGGASRFFYCAKASRVERGEGNTHPTVKPVALLRFLVRLVARPGNVVLDPFCGSGTAGVACAMEGRDFIGIEKEADYVEIARRRIEAATAQLSFALESGP